MLIEEALYIHEMHEYVCEFFNVIIDLHSIF